MIGSMRDIGTGTIMNDDAPPTVQFTAANYNVNENGTSVTLTVTKAGSTGVSATVHYATSNGTGEMCIFAAISFRERCKFAS